MPSRTINTISTYTTATSVTYSDVACVLVTPRRVESDPSDWILSMPLSTKLADCAQGRRVTPSQLRETKHHREQPLLSYPAFKSPLLSGHVSGLAPISSGALVNLDREYLRARLTEERGKINYTLFSVFAPFSSLSRLLPAPCTASNLAPNTPDPLCWAAEFMRTVHETREAVAQRERRAVMKIQGMWRVARSLRICAEKVLLAPEKRCAPGR